MVKNEFPVFIEAYNKADPSVQALIDAPDIPEFVDKLVKKYPSWQKYRNNLVNLMVDVILEVSGLRAALESIRTDQEVKELYSEEFAAEIENFINQLRSRTKPPASKVNKGEPPAQKYVTPAQTEKLKTFVQTTKPQDPAGTKAQPSEKKPGTEANPSNVKPIRTFADDVEFSRAHGYGSFRNTENQDDETVHRSSQDDIIKK